MPKKAKEESEEAPKKKKSSSSKKKLVKKDSVTRRYGKKYAADYKKIEKKEYELKEAISLLKEISSVKFDATCEVHINLNADPKHADQNVRGNVVLPHGSGKKVRIAAFVPEEKVKDAIKAGAHKAGLETLIEEVKKGKIDFDIAVAEAAVMKNIAKIAKILGQKGLMPNPKAGTVGPDAKKIIEDIGKGKMEFKNDRQGIIHSIFGKISFDEAKILKNAKALLKAIVDAKPSGIKAAYMKSISISSSMGPGIRVSVSDVLKEVKGSD